MQTDAPAAGEDAAAQTKNDTDSMLLVGVRSRRFPQYRTCRDALWDARVGDGDGSIEIEQAEYFIFL